MRRVSILVLAGLCLALPAAAAGSPSLKQIIYRGLHLAVPRSWPVFQLSQHPGLCVRFDRHAVYLGVPGADESCPPAAAGRTEAILVAPLGQPAAGAALAGSHVTRVVDRRHRLSILATWNRQPGLIARALGVHELRPALPPEVRPDWRSATGGGGTGPASGPPSSSSGTTTPAVATPGAVYTGPAFDVCSTPSSSQMSAWAASPYRAVGIYIGGANMACAQRNLTAAWTAAQAAAGWHLIPIYVGLQAPVNDCGCAAMSTNTTTAANQGSAAAQDAAAQAQAVGLGPGNPIELDMEGYSHTTSNTKAVLAFLDGWTAELHALGYLSGVYSSDGSGIADLVAEWGTGYPEPDDLWFASWNGSKTTVDYAVPSGEWANHQRLHQYNGGHNETYGHVTLNVDGDYVDAATAANGSGAAAASSPPASVGLPSIRGTAYPGWTLTEVHGQWEGSPTAFTYQWELCDSTGANCTPLLGATGTTYVVTATDLGSTLRVSETAANGSGAGPAALSAPFGPVQNPPTGGYWLFTSVGNVYNSAGATFLGSPVAQRRRLPAVVGMAATATGLGYWLVDVAGDVLAYGDAVVGTAVRPAHPVRGIVAAPGAAGGYWVFTSGGNVYPRAGAGFYGSPVARRMRLPAPIIAMAATTDGGGYWLLDAAGDVFADGDASASGGLLRAPHPLRGIVAVPRSAHGYWLFTSAGNVFERGGARFHGSPASSHVRLPAPIVGMSATPDGGGYWLVDATGHVYGFGDATQYPALSVARAVAGIAG